MSASKASKRGDSSSSDEEEQARRLQHGGKVTRSGTAGTAKVAQGRDAVRGILDAVDEMRDSNTKDKMMEAVDALSKQFDQVILAYVSKRDALQGANETVEKMQEALETAGQTEEQLREQMKKLASGHHGCGCKQGSDTSIAGRCVACGCARAGVQCSDKCSCSKFCQRPGNKSASMAEAVVVKRHKGILKVRHASASAAAAAPESGSEDESEEEEKPKKTRKSVKKEEGSDKEDKPRKAAGKKK